MPRLDSDLCTVSLAMLPGNRRNVSGLFEYVFDSVSVDSNGFMQNINPQDYTFVNNSRTKALSRLPSHVQQRLSDKRKSVQSPLENHINNLTHSEYKELNYQAGKKSTMMDSLTEFLVSIKNWYEWEWLFSLPADSCIKQQYHRLLSRSKRRSRRAARLNDAIYYSRHEPRENRYSALADLFDSSEDECLDIELTQLSGIDSNILSSAPTSYVAINYCKYCSSVYGEYCNCETSLYERLNPVVITEYLSKCSDNYYRRVFVPIKRDEEQLKKLKFSICVFRILRNKGKTLTKITNIFSRLKTLKIVNLIGYFKSRWVVPLSHMSNLSLNQLDNILQYQMMMDLPYEHHGEKDDCSDESLCSLDSVVECFAESEDCTFTGEQSLDVESSPGAVLTSSREKDVAKPIKQRSPPNWSRYVTSDVVTTYDNIVDRWILFDQFDWDKDSPEGAFKDYRVPIDIFKKCDSNFCKTNAIPIVSQLLPFKMHRYWRGDISIKIQVNSNKFQIGRLVLGSYYDGLYDLNRLFRYNRPGVVQLNHVVVDAGCSNEAILVIPYNHYAPFVATTVLPEFPIPLYFAEMYLVIFNSLQVVTGGPGKCGVSLYFKIDNSKFTGLKASNLGIPCSAEMDRLGVTLAELALDSILPDKNRDNPPDNAPPNYIVPTASHSWCIGNGVSEPIHCLRLDVTGQTRHMEISDTPMTVSAIANKYGFIKTINWSKDMISGYQLLDIEAGPMIDVSQYQSLKQHIEIYWLPPVAMMSSLFKQWRGTLTFRVDIIATQFHTGSILMAYIPGAQSDDNITLEVAKNSPYTVFTLQESKSFEFQVPYISNLDWWPRKYAGGVNRNSVFSPSRLYMFVVNSLVPMQSVVEKINLNLFVKAGSDFEVSVPIQPNVGLAFNVNVPLPDIDKIQAVDGYFPYYAGTWHSLGDGNKLVFRWGAASDQIAQFSSYRYPIIKKPGEESTLYYYRRGEGVTTPTYWNGASEVSVEFIVVTASGHGYNIALPVGSNVIAEKLAIAIFIEHKAPPNEFLLSYSSKGKYDYGNARNEKWEVVAFKYVIPKLDCDKQSPFIFVNYEGENENNVASLAPTNLLSSTGFGMSNYGESFNDLKNLCRRYQYYGSAYITANTLDLNGKCAFSFPALPYGLDLEIHRGNNINEFVNRCRDGIIPIVASCYRYFRGSLRFRLVFQNSKDCAIWVQHRPDRLLVNKKISICTKVESVSSLYNHAYATYIQLSSVNSVIEIEVPFYLAGCYGLLQRPVLSYTQEAFFESLGEVVVGLAFNVNDQSKLKDLNVNIYYSLADDMTFSSFQGFPPCLLLDEIAPLAISCSHEGFREILDKAVKSVSRPAIDIAKEEVAETARLCVEEISTTLTEKFGEHILTNPTFTILVTNLVHGLINPSFQTIAWSVCSCLYQFGILTLATIHTASAKLSSIFSTWYGSSELRSEPIMCKSENLTEDEWGSFASIIYFGVASLVSVKTVPSINFKTGLARFLMKDVGLITRSANSVCTFVKNCFSLISKFIDYLMFINDDTASLRKRIESSLPEVKDWCIRVMNVTNPAVKKRDLYFAYYHDEVQHLINFGQLILSENSNLRTDANMHLIIRLYEKITVLHDELLSMGLHSHIRKMPFTICLSGKPGVGKSYLQQALSVELLRCINYKSDNSDLLCYINPLSKYWDQCNNQPVLVVDDLFSVETGESLDNQLNLLFQVHSPIVLSPPMASLEDKKKRYNPEIFLICTNKPFPQFDRVNVDAIYRRRDVLIDVRLSKLTPDRKCPHCTGTPINQVSPKFLSDFHHLEFGIYDNVLINKPPPVYLPYVLFVENLKKRFITNRENVSADFERRLHELNSFRTSEHLEFKIDTEFNLFDLMSQRRYCDQQQLNSLKQTIFSDLGENFIKKFSYLRDSIAKYCVQSSAQSDDDILEEPSTSQFEVDDTAINELVVPEPSLLKLLINNIEPFNRLEDRVLKTFKYFGNDKILCQALSESLDEILETPSDQKLTLTQLYYLLGFKMRKVSPCLHYRLNPMSAVYNAFSDEFSLPTGCAYTPVSCKSCKESLCLMNSPWFEYSFWYIQFKHKFSIRNAFRNGNYKLLPSYMACYSDVVEEFDNKWLKFVDYFKGSWLLYVGCKLKSFYNILKKWIYPLLCMLGIGLYGFGMYRMMNEPIHLHNHNINLAAGTKLVEWSTIEAQPYNATVKHVTETKLPLATLGVAETNSQQFDVVIDRLLNNSVDILCRFEGREILYRCLIVRHRQLLFVRHYMELAKMHAAQSNAKFYFRYTFNNKQRLSGKELEIDFVNLPTRYMSYGKLDYFTSNYGIVELPINIPEGKDIVKFICPLSQHKYGNGNGVLVESGRRIHIGVKYEYKDAIPHQIKPEDCVNTVVMQEVYTYKYHGNGVCGSVLVAENLEAPIIGMHVAGITGDLGYGISEPLTREMFDGIKDSSVPYVDFVVPVLDDISFSKIDLESTLLLYGTVPPTLAHGQSTETSYTKSEICGVFPIRTEPNPLGKLDPRLPDKVSPLKLGVEKHGQPPRLFNTSDLNLAVQDLQDLIRQNCKKVRPLISKFSLQDAVCGISDIPEFEALSWSTSPGFPYLHSRPKGVSGKRYLFDLAEHQSGWKLLNIDKNLLSILTVKENMRERGIKPFTVFVNCLKDTTLPIEKCSIPGKTRIFSISPVDFTIQFRQYYWDFCASYQRNRMSLEHSIGINCDSLEWTQLLSRLTRNSTNFVAGDYSNFGPSLSLQVADRAFDIILDWYAYNGVSDDVGVRSIMKHEILNAYNLCVNVVYRTPCGIPSGSPITTPLNSLVNSLYIRLAWLHLVNKDLFEFRNNVVLYTYGDDVLMTVNEKYKELFNTVTLSKFFSLYNIKFTDADKSGDLVTFRTIEDITFLKRNFVSHPHRVGVYLAPLDIVSVEGAANWINKKGNQRSNTIENAKQSCELMFGHGPQRYEEHRLKILQALSLIGVDDVLIPSWSCLDERVFG